MKDTLMTLLSKQCFVQTLVAVTLVATVTMDSSHTLAAEPLRVMSFNIRYGTANDGKNAWPLRKELVLSTITDFGPDLLGTQETQPDQAAHLRESLPAYKYFGWARDESKTSEECGILIRTERFEVVDSGQFWLSETPDEKFSKSWDSSLPRVVTWTVLKDRQADQREFVFANTHFDHRGETARQESAKLIRKRMAEQVPGLPVILSGDFNCAEGSPAYKSLAADGVLLDTYRSAHPSRLESEGTFHSFTGKPGADRIDWIMTTVHFKMLSAEIVRFNDNGRYPSDHFPVTALVDWIPNK